MIRIKIACPLLAFLPHRVALSVIDVLALYVHRARQP